MVAYRQFRNSDPPQLVRLWNASGLGRGAALGLSCDDFDEAVIAQTYFDPAGLIVATTDNQQVVGFVHTGFAADETRSRLSKKTGVICAVIVAEAHRRQGIGSELILLAEAYLRSEGAENLYAGGANPRDPFYLGLYGGSESAGFLESDPAAHPFLIAQGYTPFERHLVFQRELGAGGPEIVSVRLLNAKRQAKLAEATACEPKDWWWSTHQGRLGSMQLGLTPKAGGPLIAQVCVVGLDFYAKGWQVRAIGITKLQVIESQRRKGFGQLLLDEVCRRVRNEMIQFAEAHVTETDVAGIAVLKSAGFQQTDAGVVYLKTSPVVG